MLHKNKNNKSDEEKRIEEVLTWKNKIVKHFKGDKYIIEDFATYSEDLNRKMVVYRALYGECELYVRPLDMFCEKCNEIQYEEFKQEYRFELERIESVK